MSCVSHEEGLEHVIAASARFDWPTFLLNPGLGSNTKILFKILNLAFIKDFYGTAKRNITSSLRGSII